MPAILTPNGKAAAVTSCDGLRFVFTTTHPIQENRTHAHYHISHAQRKPL